MEKEAETASSRQAGVKPLAPKKSQQTCCRRDCEVAERRAAVRAGRGRRMLLAGPVPDSTWYVRTCLLQYPCLFHCCLTGVSACVEL